MEKRISSDNKSMPDPGIGKNNIPKTSSELAKKDRKPKYFRAVKTVLIVALLFIPIGIGFLIFSYYKLNFTPSAILKKSVVNFINKKNVDYDGTIDLTFSYADKEEKFSVNDVEIYSLLKKSVSDSHSVKIFGRHSWENGTHSGKFDLTWKVSDKNVFSFEGNYQNSSLYYKITPHIYPDLVDEDVKNNYSEIDLNEFFSKIASEGDRDLVSGIEISDVIFDVTEVFQNDTIDGRVVRHYKVKLSGKNEAEKLLNNFNYNDFDVWIEKKSQQIKKIKGAVTVNDIGAEGNNMELQFDIKFK